MRVAVDVGAAMRMVVAVWVVVTALVSVAFGMRLGVRIATSPDALDQRRDAPIAMTRPPSVCDTVPAGRIFGRAAQQVALAPISAGASHRYTRPVPDHVRPNNEPPAPSVRTSP